MFPFLDYPVGYIPTVVFPTVRRERPSHVKGRKHASLKLRSRKRKASRKAKHRRKHA